MGNNSLTPERWNRSVLFTVATILSVPPLVSNLSLLYFLLSSWDPNGWYQTITKDTGISYGSITTAMFLKVG